MLTHFSPAFIFEVWAEAEGRGLDLCEKCSKND